jgi:hypothetical protein
VKTIYFSEMSVFNGLHGFISQKIELFKKWICCLYFRRASTAVSLTYMWCGMHTRWTAGKCHSLTHGAEPFLRSCQLCSYWRTSQQFMESEGSLKYSQEPSTGPYPKPDQSNPYHPNLSLSLSEIHFNIVHSPTSWSSQWSPFFRIFHQYPICISLLTTFMLHALPISYEFP